MAEGNITATAFFPSLATVLEHLYILLLHFSSTDLHQVRSGGQNMSVVHLSDDNFESEVTKSDQPVIVDFWASWCMPCQMMAPVFEDLSKEYVGKLKFAKLSTEEAGEIAQQHKINSIPCLVVFNKGKEVERIVGFAPKPAMKQKIDLVLKKI